MNDIATALARNLRSSQQRACMVCAERKRTVHVRGGGEVCDQCAMNVPVEMLPEVLIEEVQWLHGNGVAPAAWAPQLGMTPGTLVARRMKAERDEQRERAEWSIEKGINWRNRAERAEADLAAARQQLDQVRALFAGGPDTPCRTTWPDGVECVEVPITDLRRALDAAPPDQTGGDD